MNSEIEAGDNGGNVVYNAHFNTDGTFLGDNRFDTLTFTPGFFYRYQQGSTQTVSDEWNVTGTCEAPIHMQSLRNGQTGSILYQPSAQLEVEYLSLRDIVATGPSIPIVADFSIDLGNNSGWDITEPIHSNKYWVNGTGNWDDPQHWSLTSGGTPGACPPNERENAIFDAGSSRLTMIQYSLMLVMLFAMI